MSKKENQLPKGWEIKKLNEYFKLIGYVLITFIVVWILALISNKCFGIEINSDTAIISFIGIIATFIVVGNYSQVAEMRNQALEQTKSYNLKIDEFNLKLAEIEDLKQKLELKEEQIGILESEFYESQFNNYMYIGAQYLMSNHFNISFYMFIKSFDLLTKIMYNSENLTVIDYLKSNIDDVDKSVYTKDEANDLINIAAKAKNIEGIDIGKIDELLEVIKKKNAELGF